MNFINVRMVRDSRAAPSSPRTDFKNNDPEHGED